MWCCSSRHTLELAHNNIAVVTRYGNIDRMLSLLKEGVDVNTRGFGGNTALHELISYGQHSTSRRIKERVLTLISVLLEHGAHPLFSNFERETALYLACTSDYIPLDVIIKLYDKAVQQSVSYQLLTIVLKDVFLQEDKTKWNGLFPRFLEFSKQDLEMKHITLCQLINAGIIFKCEEDMLKCVYDEVDQTGINKVLSVAIHTAAFLKVEDSLKLLLKWAAIASASVNLAEAIAIVLSCCITCEEDHEDMMFTLIQACSHLQPPSEDTVKFFTNVLLKNDIPGDEFIPDYSHVMPWHPFSRFATFKSALEDQLSLGPLAVALKKERMDAIEAMYKAGCIAPVTLLDNVTIQGEMDYPTGFVDSIFQLVLTPLKLTECCRIRVKRQLGKDFITKVVDLPVPERLKDFLMMREYGGLL